MSSASHKPALKRAPFAAPLLLGLLETHPQHGYALHKILQTDLRGICHINMNRLYALLDEMEAQGHIRGHVDASVAGPARKTYAITAKGRRALQTWLASPCPSMREMRIDFPLKLYLARQRSADVTAALIDAQRESCQRELERMSAQQRRTSDDFLPMIFTFRVGQIKAGIAWLDQCKRKLNCAVVPA